MRIRSLVLSGESEWRCFEPTRVRIGSSYKDSGSQWGMWLAQDPLATCPFSLILIVREVQISGFPLRWTRGLRAHICS